MQTTDAIAGSKLGSGTVDKTKTVCPPGEYPVDMVDDSSVARLS